MVSGFPVFGILTKSYSNIIFSTTTSSESQSHNDSIVSFYAYTTHVISTTHGLMPFLWSFSFLSESAIWTASTVGVNGSAGLHKTGLCFHYSPSSPLHTRLFRHTLIVLHCVAGQTRSQEEWDWGLLTKSCLLSLERQQQQHNRKKAESRDACMPPKWLGFKPRLGHFGVFKMKVFYLAGFSVVVSLSNTLFSFR